MRSDPWFQDWAAGRTAAFEAAKVWPWLDLVQEAAARGVSVRRVRIISVPESEYARLEHATTDPDIEAGEEIRWLPRRLASSLFLPGNDCWIIDGKAILFNHFIDEGDLSPQGKEFVTDPGLAERCRSAFLAAWNLAIDHTEYKLS